jgi:hypothetical protein
VGLKTLEAGTRLNGRTMAISVGPFYRWGPDKTPWCSIGGQEAKTEILA